MVDKSTRDVLSVALFLWCLRSPVAFFVTGLCLIIIGLISISKMSVYENELREIREYNQYALFKRKLPEPPFHYKLFDALMSTKTVWCLFGK